MCSKISILLVFCIVLFNCSTFVDSQQEQVPDKPIASESPNERVIQRNVNDDVPELKANDKFAIYGQVLRRVLVNSHNIFGEMKGSDALAYRLETIAPTGLGQIEGNSDISPILIKNLKIVNNSSEILADEFALTHPIIAEIGDRDLKTFYEKVKRKNPITRAVISFSKVGFNYTSDGILYMEFYRPETGLIKVYLLLRFSDIDERILPGTIDGNILEITKILEVN